MPDLRPLLWPRSVAVIGASSNTEIIRGRLLQIMLLRDFPGRIYPVTRSQSEVQGLRAYPSISDVPEPVDLAVIVIPAAAVPDALEQCGARGVKGRSRPPSARPSSMPRRRSPPTSRVAGPWPSSPRAAGSASRT